MQPPVDKLPAGDWFCHECSPSYVSLQSLLQPEETLAPPQEVNRALIGQTVTFKFEQVGWDRATVRKVFAPSQIKVGGFNVELKFLSDGTLRNAKLSAASYTTEDTAPAGSWALIATPARDNDGPAPKKGRKKKCV
jgi:hypothetical protein